MEDILRPIYQERASQEKTLAIIMIEKINHLSPLTDSLDVVLFVITDEREKPHFIKHYEFGGKKASLTIMTKAELIETIRLGTNRRIVDWILNGKILYDRNDYIVNLIDELNSFPFSERKFKIGVEYGKLIRRYLEGKVFFESGQFLDAYNHAIRALHHLARLEVIDRGYHPEVTVWNQVKQLEPQIYKLYKELVESDESLEKRLELLFLASDFLIRSKIDVGAAHILTVMSEKEAWQYNELHHHPELNCYSVDLNIMLEFLIEKKYVCVKLIETKGKGIYHRTFSVSKKY